MEIVNREEYKEIDVSTLGLSTRTLNCLMRVRWNTLYLVIENREKLSTVRNMGAKSIEEIDRLLADIARNGVPRPTTLPEEDIKSEADTLMEKSCPEIVLSDELLLRPVSDLKVPVRVLHALQSARIKTVGQALALGPNEILKLRNMGALSARQLQEQLALVRMRSVEYFVSDACNSEEDEEPIVLPEEILSRPVDDLKVPVRVLHALKDEEIDTIRQALALTSEEIRHMRKMGQLSARQLQEQLALLREQADAYFDLASCEATEEVELDNAPSRELDIVTAKKLMGAYGLKTTWLCEQYQITKQRVHQKLTKRTNNGRWLGKPLLPEERSIVTSMINTRSYYWKQDGLACWLYNNRKDDCAFLLVSDDDIKCFFLADLPEALQALTKRQNLDRFTEAEVDALDSLGHEISILKKPHFMVDNAEQFRTLASARGLSLEEYSQFLYSLPYCSAKTTITDDRIISFLKENTVNGRTFIPSTPDTQWIRSYISRSPYSTDDFIAFYGFRTDGDPNEADGSEGLEPDMQVHGTGSDYLEKLYSDTPLLGSRILSQKNLDTLNQNSRRYLEHFLNNPSVKPDLKAEMQIALAVINYAKSWDTEDESGFWRYITAQFGYRDRGERLRSLLCRCVKDALLYNQRWFVINSSGNQFKSSIVVHAFSPKRSWLYFCDFLFDFYKTNLDWQYIEGDPMITRMVLALRSKLRETDDVQDEEFEISSKVYYFRECIIKLLVHRPYYAAQLTESLIKRIDGLVNHTATPAAAYEEQLVDQWMADKLQGLSSGQRRTPSQQTRSVAIDYTKIRPVYRLENESEVSIVLPDVRLAQNDFTSLRLTILRKGEPVEQRTLSYYGNELGKTMSGFSLKLEDYLRRSASGAFDPQIIISCDNEEIFNSEKTLYRDFLVFKNKEETDVDRCEKGGYSIFAPSGKNLSFENAEVSLIRESSRLNAYYVDLQKDFVIREDGELVAVDNAQDGDALRIILRGGECAADYLANGIRYSVIEEDRVVEIISPGQGSEKKYRLAVNDEIIDLRALPHEDSAGHTVYKLALGKQSSDEMSLRLMDLENNRLLLRRNLKILHGFSFRFDKPYYFSAEDYHNAKLSVCFGNDAEREIPIAMGETRILVPWHNGELEIPVPVICVRDNSNTKWTGQNICWIKDIPQDRFLYVKAPNGYDLSMRLDEQSVGTETVNSFALGNALLAYSGDRDRLNITLSVSKHGQLQSQYLLGKIFIKEQFLKKPQLTLTGSRLQWDFGGGFYGDRSAALRLTVAEGTELERSFEVKTGEELITEDFTLPLGEYPYTISKQSGNLFAMQMKTLASGSLFVGDVNELRFLKSIIQLEAITFEDETRYSSVRIRPCYIDHITYKGVQYDFSEGRECPIYGGTLFYTGEGGKRCEFSYQDGMDDKGHQLYQINPVRIVYINDHTLSITQDTGDPNDPGAGFYYYRYYDRNMMKNIYKLTDWEPTRSSRENYFLADLYLYSRRGV